MNFTGLKQLPWPVTENACTALHKPTTVATSNLLTSSPFFQVIYACFVVGFFWFVLFCFFPLHIFLKQEFCNPNYILIAVVQTPAKLSPWLYQIQCCQPGRVSCELHDVKFFCKPSFEESCSRENLSVHILVYFCMLIDARKGAKCDFRC